MWLLKELLAHINIFNTFKSYCIRTYETPLRICYMYTLFKVLQCIITESKNALDIYAYCVCENVLPYSAFRTLPIIKGIFMKQLEIFPEKYSRNGR